MDALSVDKSWIGGYLSTYFKMYEIKFGPINMHNQFWKNKIAFDLSTLAIVEC
jgi:hypothetical protein